jgi:hypothetical protein
VVDAEAGMIVGGGKGAVYGMRIRGMPGTLSSNNCRRHLHHKDVVGESLEGSGEARHSRMSSPALVRSHGLAECDWCARRTAISCSCMMLGMARRSPVPHARTRSFCRVFVLPTATLLLASRALLAASCASLA